MLLIHVIRSLPMMRGCPSVSEGLLEAFRSRKRRISLVIEGCGNFVGSLAKNLRPFSFVPKGLSTHGFVFNPLFYYEATCAHLSLVQFW